MAGHHRHIPGPVFTSSAPTAAPGIAVVPAPRAPEPAPASVVDQLRGWGARRARRAEAARAAALATQIAHAQRRARQVALATQTSEKLGHGCDA